MTLKFKTLTPSLLKLKLIPQNKTSHISNVIYTRRTWHLTESQSFWLFSFSLTVSLLLLEKRTSGRLLPFSWSAFPGVIGATIYWCQGVVWSALYSPPSEKLYDFEDVETLTQIDKTYIAHHSSSRVINKTANWSFLNVVLKVRFLNSLWNINANIR